MKTKLTATKRKALRKKIALLEKEIKALGQRQIRTVMNFPHGRFDDPEEVSKRIQNHPSIRSLQSDISQKKEKVRALQQKIKCA